MHLRFRCFVYGFILLCSGIAAPAHASEPGTVPSTFITDLATKALLSAAPIPDPAVERTRKRIKIPGEPPSPMDPKAAFRFAPSRLPVDPNGPFGAPELKEVAPGHLVSEFDPPS